MSERVKKCPSQFLKSPNPKEIYFNKIYNIENQNIFIFERLKNIFSAIVCIKNN